MVDLLLPAELDVRWKHRKRRDAVNFHVESLGGHGLKPMARAYLQTSLGPYKDQANCLSTARGCP